jgi:hypothetical protein
MNDIIYFVTIIVKLALIWLGVPMLFIGFFALAIRYWWIGFPVLLIFVLGLLKGILSGGLLLQ